MMETDPIQAFYRDNPRMVSSPFGGVDSFQGGLFAEVLQRLHISIFGKDVLDVGCGRGFAGEAVRGMGGTYTGVDFVCSRRGFRLALGDAAFLPFASQSFDVLFCVDAFEHFPRPESAAQEFYRVLRPGGCFFLSAPNYGNVAGLVKYAVEGMGWYRPASWAPFGRWQPQEFEQALTPGWIRRIHRRAGFCALRAVGYAPETGLGLFPWLDHPRMPDAIRYRGQRLFRALGPGIVSVWPGASLHLFWRMEKPM